MEFFFLSVKGGLSRVSWCLRGGSPLTTALLLPIQHSGTGDTQGRGRSQVRGSFGDGTGMESTFPAPWVSKKAGKGERRWPLP